MTTIQPQRIVAGFLLFFSLVAILMLHFEKLRAKRDGDECTQLSGYGGCTAHGPGTRRIYFSRLTIIFDKYPVHHQQRCFVRILDFDGLNVANRLSVSRGWQARKPSTSKARSRLKEVVSRESRLKIQIFRELHGSISFLDEFERGPSP